jgi:hypothetical protein
MMQFLKKKRIEGKEEKERASNTIKTFNHRPYPMYVFIEQHLQSYFHTVPGTTFRN